MTNEQEQCPYCRGVKRIRDDESAMKAVVLINNEISRKLIKARKWQKWKIEKN